MSGLIFPNVGLAVLFAALLMGTLAVASWIDLKTLRIPKTLSLGLLFGGIVMSGIRGLWAGAEGLPGWAFNNPSAILGFIDAEMFSIAGAMTGFALFFTLWIARIFVGGGDVKLVTAVGAWLGPVGILLAALVSLGVFAIMAVGRISYEITQGVMPSFAPRQAGLQSKRRRVSYSLSFAISTGLILIYAFRRPLGLDVLPAS